MFWLGLLLVMLAGALAGGGGAPLKLMRRFRYEHWAFASSLCGMVLLPWAATLVLCPDALGAYGSLPPGLLWRANLFSLAWGIANVLCGLCLVRIGFSLSIGLLTGIGLPIGVLVPMILRGSGRFAESPSLFSTAGAIILVGVAVMLGGVALMTRAGFGRDAGRPPREGGSFAVGLLMAVTAGFLQVGLSFAFVYCQGPIAAALAERGASEAAADLGVWAVTLPGGALVNLAYPAWLLSRGRGWGELRREPRDMGWSLLMGLLFFLFVLSMGAGMRRMGPLGASAGFGIYQGLQLLASQAVGFASGEWRGVTARPRLQMVSALALLLMAVVILSVGKAAG
jgi:hypothetical protein